jgi:hypothetical protein
VWVGGRREADSLSDWEDHLRTTWSGSHLLDRITLIVEWNKNKQKIGGGGASVLVSSPSFVGGLPLGKFRFLHFMVLVLNAFSNSLLPPETPRCVIFCQDLGRRPQGEDCLGSGDVQ